MFVKMRILTPLPVFTSNISVATDLLTVERIQTLRDISNQNDISEQSDTMFTSY